MFVVQHSYQHYVCVCNVIVSSSFEEASFLFFVRRAIDINVVGMASAEDDEDVLNAGWGLGDETLAAIERGAEARQPRATLQRLERRRPIGRAWLATRYARYMCARLAAAYTLCWQDVHRTWRLPIRMGCVNCGAPTGSFCDNCGDALCADCNEEFMGICRRRPPLSNGRVRDT